MDEPNHLKQAKLDELRRDVRKGLDSGESEPWDVAALKVKALARRGARPAKGFMTSDARAPKNT